VATALCRRVQVGNNTKSPRHSEAAIKTTLYSLMLVDCYYYFSSSMSLFQI
jgi:hypothetical protein